MIIEEIMKKSVITLTPDDTVGRAKLLMFENGVRHLPVVDQDSKLIGLVTRTNLLSTQTDKGIDNHTRVEMIMNHNVISGHPLDFVEEASAIFYEQKIGCLPIVEDDKLIGIITETDMLHTFVQLTGAHQPGSQIEISVQNRTGMLSEVVSIIKQHKVNILSVLVYPDKDETKKILVFRVQTMNPLSLIEDLKSNGYHVLWPRFPGVTYE